MPIPIAPVQLQAGLKHVCYEYVCMLAGALEMTNPSHQRPVNLLIQDATLIHLRAMAEFFQATGGTHHPDLRASFYCVKVTWNHAHFDRHSKLMMALDKCLAHISLARDLTDPNCGLAVAWHGPDHLHGTIALMLKTWGEFQSALLQRFEAPLDVCLEEAQKAVDYLLVDFEPKFLGKCKERGYTLGRLP